MTGVLLRLVPLTALLLVLLAFWYPTPEVVRVEAVDWAARYERAQTPRFGAFSAAQARARPDRPKETLEAFIARETGGGPVPVRGEAWDALLATVPASGTVDGYVRPDTVPMDLAPGATAYVTVGAGNDARVLSLAQRTTADLRSWEGIPAAVLFPLRAWWPAMLAGLAGAAGVGWAGSGGGRRQPQARAAETTHGRAVVWTLGLALVGAVAMAMPHIYGLWGADIGFAATLVGLLLVLTGVISSALFAGAVWALDRLLSGRDRLVRWTYPQADWMAFVGVEHERQRAAAGPALALVGGLMVLVGGGFVLFAEDTEAALVTVAVLGGVFALIAGVAVLTPWLGARRLRRGPFEVQVGPRALYRGGQSHVWGGLLGRFEGARITTAPRPTLLVHYSMLQALGGRFITVYRRHETVPLPIPEGQQAEAHRVAQALNRHHGVQQDAP